ncbi:MAG: GNAT family N-acetyltransferase [Verrucomicrobiae bacterium]|nr:GNAT family N-acetyltransferase [Verrucomicrobiae bacterium]
MKPPAEPQPAPPDEWLAELPLSGGATVRFRHLRPDDESFIADAAKTASRETLLHRFFSPIRRVPPELLHQLLAINRDRETCVLGVVASSESTRIVCGARYVRLAQPATAEIALTVHDDFQRRGLGTFMVRLLARLARAEGLRWFEAEVMASNERMLHVFRKVAAGGFTAHWTGDNYHLVLDVRAIVRENSGTSIISPPGRSCSGDPDCS